MNIPDLTKPVIEDVTLVIAPTMPSTIFIPACAAILPIAIAPTENCWAICCEAPPIFSACRATSCPDETKRPIASHA